MNSKKETKEALVLLKEYQIIANELKISYNIDCKLVKTVNKPDDKLLKESSNEFVLGLAAALRELDDNFVDLNEQYLADAIKDKRSWIDFDAVREAVEFIDGHWEEMKALTVALDNCGYLEKMKQNPYVKSLIEIMRSDYIL